MFDYTKKRVQKEVPIWHIYYGGREIGYMTKFPLDGPTCTVRIEAARPNGDQVALERTVEASTVNMCFERAKEAHESMIEDMVLAMVP